MMNAQKFPAGIPSRENSIPPQAVTFFSPTEHPSPSIFGSHSWFSGSVRKQLYTWWGRVVEFFGKAILGTLSSRVLTASPQHLHYPHSRNTTGLKCGGFQIAKLPKDPLRYGPTCGTYFSSQSQWKNACTSIGKQVGCRQLESNVKTDALQQHNVGPAKAHDCTWCVKIPFHELHLHEWFQWLSGGQGPWGQKETQMWGYITKQYNGMYPNLCNWSKQNHLW